jgi:protein regulator of cytokinesis 1
LQLKDELKRCEQLKRQNIKRFVEEIQKELKYWWDKCLIGEEERLQFLPHSSECFTEDLLELHELEVQKFRSYYTQNMYVIVIYCTKQMLLACDSVTRIESVCIAFIHLSPAVQGSR